MKISVAGDNLWIPVKYEKLPKFCFGCGRILHEDGCCSLEEPPSSEQFGVWLRIEVHHKPWPRKGEVDPSNQWPNPHSKSLAKKEPLDSSGPGATLEQDLNPTKNLSRISSSCPLTLIEGILSKDILAAFKQTSKRENTNILFETGIDKGEARCKKGKEEDTQGVKVNRQHSKES